MHKIIRCSFIFIGSLAMLGFFLSRCSNNPWPSEYTQQNTLFTSYSSAIKSLDSATCYFVHESAILDNIVEPLLSYEYLTRPYKLKPQLLAKIPTPVYFDHNNHILTGDPPPEIVTRTEYTLEIEPEHRYQPHPCFAQPREVTSEDLKISMTRLCDPRLASPVYSTLSSFITGMHECSDAIREKIHRQQTAQSQTNPQESILVDYRKIPFAGLEIVSTHTCKLILSRKYPQVLYWMAMHFMAPITWEALSYYNNPEIISQGTHFKNHPVGSGAYMLKDFAPNQKIILTKNPNYAFGHPTENASIENIYFQFERESIPNWIKFQQGYYDNSGVPGDMFDSAIIMNPTGELSLSPKMRSRGMNLDSIISPIIYYFGFNMLDPEVGGITPQKRALRQAISIVLNYQEYIDIFLNGQGLPAQSIIPPEIFGGGTTQKYCNPYIDQWDAKQNRFRRKSIKEARALMKEAGYPGGIGSNGTPLTLFLDHAAAGSTAFKAQFQWLKGKFSLLGIQLQERPSDLNRWRDKLATGNWQLIFNKGWVADYPDPENFLFLFYSKNGVVASHGRGANYVNYSSPEYDPIFKNLETMPNSPARAKLIQQANDILQKDAPCCWGFYPAKVVLTHKWLKNYKLHDVAYDTMKYQKIDIKQRQQCQKEWNKPKIMPVLIACTLIAFSMMMGLFFRRKK